MVYDFITPQPIESKPIPLRGFLRWKTTFIPKCLCLASWPYFHDSYEPVFISILRNTATAMGPRSRLIVADVISSEKTEVGEDLIIY